MVSTLKAMGKQARVQRRQAAVERAAHPEEAAVAALVDVMWRRLWDHWCAVVVHLTQAARNAAGEHSVVKGLRLTVTDFHTLRRQLVASGKTWPSYGYLPAPLAGAWLVRSARWPDLPDFFEGIGAYASVWEEVG